MPISSGIKFLMYRIHRLVALVYIRQPLRHQDGPGRGPQSAAKYSIKAGAK
jgi:hypothetical protein